MANWTIDADALALLAVHALNTVGYDDEDGTPCCGTCCGPCHALLHLLSKEYDPDNNLDALLEKRGPGHDWWDDDLYAVDRTWIAHHIAPNCDLCRTDESEKSPDV